MQKRSAKSVVAALLVASAHSQTVTSTIPVCPTAISTTITLPTTVTFCPGPHCNGGAPLPTAPPNGVGQAPIHLGEYTSVGTDGKTTVLGIYETVFDSICETGLVPATWTITSACPGSCGHAPAATALPEGFETKVVPCGVCGPHTSTVTLTQPCPTGPYASVTPTVQQPAVAAPAGAAVAAAAQASAGSSSGASAQAGPGVVSPGSTTPGSASANAGSGSGAAAQAGQNGASANAVSGASAGAQAGNAAPVAVPGNKVSPVNGTAPAVSGVSKPAAPGVSPYVSSGTKTAYAGLTIFAGILFAILL